MRHLLRIGLLSAALTLLGACSTITDGLTAIGIGGGTSAAASAAPAAVTATIQVAEKALTSIHLVHKAAADFATIAAKNGWVHGQDALTVKGYLDQSETYLEAGDAALAVGNAPGVMAKISAAQDLLAKVHAITGQTP